MSGHVRTQRTTAILSMTAVGAEQASSSHSGNKKQDESQDPQVRSCLTLPSMSTSRAEAHLSPHWRQTPRSEVMSSTLRSLMTRELLAVRAKLHSVGLHQPHYPRSPDSSLGPIAIQAIHDPLGKQKPQQIP